jgi:hypothetical protein
MKEVIVMKTMVQYFLMLMSLIIASYLVNTATAADKSEVLYLTFDDDKPKDLSPNKTPLANILKRAKLVKGVVGKAWLFDNNTAVLIDHQTFNTAFQESTFSVWLKEPGKEGILYEEGGGTNGYAVTLVGGKVEFATRDSGNQTTIKARYPFDGKWHVVITVFDQGTMQLYIDGALEKEESRVAGIGGHGNEMGIGQVNGGSAGGVAPKFTGVMDEFRITRRARTEKEIQEMIKDLLPVTPKSRLTTVWARIRSS